jgi:MATE family multidrug resistance protein
LASPPPVQAAAAIRRRPVWAAELFEQLRLGAPLIAAQLATIALTTTDVIMTSWLGPEPLAAASLGTALIHPFHMLGAGVAMAVAPMVSQALGARRRREARRSLRQGLWAAALMAALMIPIMLFARPILLASGQAPEIAELSGAYLDGAAWMLAPALAFMALRSFLAAHGDTRVVMLVALGGVAVNAVANYALIFGAFGLPRLELLGAGISTTLTQFFMAGLLALRVLRHRRYRRYAAFARFHRADWPRFRAILRMGLPIGLTFAAESGLFSGVALLMGRLGPAELAAHAAALQLASIAFMTPLGFSHATTVRVGHAVGRGDRAGAARAAWVSLGATLAFMALTAALFVAAPQTLIGLFLDPSDPAAAAPFALAVGYLGVAALFQIVDGMQVAASAALRGMGDTAVPMAIAIGGYWLIGLPCAWALGFLTDLRGIGVWLGLAAGLAAAATLLLARLAIKTRGGAPEARRP